MKCLKDGCKAPALKHDQYCYWHSENTKEQRKQSAQKGGSRKILQVESVPSTVSGYTLTVQVFCLPDTTNPVCHEYRSHQSIS